MKQKAFTLAEVMIVLTVIGIISAIIYPVASQSVPKKEIMLFKKGHNTLYQVISTLLNSDKYYKDGDLGLKPDGSWVVDTDYFCNTFGDIVTSRSVKCTKNISYYYGSTVKSDIYEDQIMNGAITAVSTIPEALDYYCKASNIPFDNYIVTADNITYFSPSDYLAFGMDADPCGSRVIPCGIYRNYYYLKWDRKGIEMPNNYHSSEALFYYRHKIFCMDIDGLNKGEDPFGYGIRVDGKIMNGKKATEWLDKGLSDD